MLGATMKDDLESVAYILIYLIRGQLPWFSIEIVTTPAQENVLTVMENFRDPNSLTMMRKPQNLCDGLEDCKHCIQLQL